MAKIRIGSVGLGGVSSGVHIPGIRASADLALTALCDIDAERLREKAAAYGVDEAHCFTDYRDLAACPDVVELDLGDRSAMASLADGQVAILGYEEVGNPADDRYPAFNTKLVIGTNNTELNEGGFNDMLGHFETIVEDTGGVFLFNTFGRYL